MTSYELTRRDALAALAATGAAAGVGAMTWTALDDDRGPTDAQRATILAVAETVYPDAVENVDAFVEAFVAGRIRDRPEHAAGVRDAVAALDEYARHFEDRPFRELSPAARDDVLRDFGVDAADPDPAGQPRERVRYYLVNDLLYALFTSPTGSELVGLENPQGHPGGLASYRRPPDGE